MANVSNGKLPERLETANMYSKIETVFYYAGSVFFFFFPLLNRKRYQLLRN